MASPSSQRPEARPVPAPADPRLLEQQAQWYFTEEQLTRTPSILDGMRIEDEHTGRSKGVNFISQVGIMLKIPQPALYTASVYLQRFYMRRSMYDLPQRQAYHPYTMAGACLFLAAKEEENIRKIKDITIACVRVAQKKPNLVVDEQDKEFWRWKDLVLHHEDTVLEVNCFDVQVEQPYRILYEYMCFFGVDGHKGLRNATWAFVNDSSYTVLCLQFHARVIAASALYAGARMCDVPLEDDAAGRPWWEQIDVNLSEVQRVCHRLAELYEKTSIYHRSQPWKAVVFGESDMSQEAAPPRPHSAAGSTSEGEMNGRKRSREAEDRPRHPSSRLPVKNGSSIDSHERSPKRQRLTPDPRHDSNPTHGHDASSSQVSASSQQSLNGHEHHHQTYSPQKSSRLPAAATHHPNRRPPPQQQQQQQQKQRGAPSVIPDVVQRQIDDIIARNDKPTGTGSDNHQPAAWDRDRDRDRDRHPRDHDQRDNRRRSSATNTSVSGSGERRHSAENSHHPLPPPPPSTFSSSNRIPTGTARTNGDDEDEEDEEGEIKDTTNHTNPGKDPQLALQVHDDGDEGGGGSEEGEL
jgi:hypothetical protein